MNSITEHDGASVNSNGGFGPGEGLGTEAVVDGRATRWAEHRSARRLEMVREVRRVVHERGPDISMEEIAGALGTSKSILYRYFQDKTALQVAVGEYILGRARVRLAEAATSSRDPRRAVEAMVATYLETVDRSRNVFLFVNRPQQAASEGNLRIFVSQVEDLVASQISQLVEDEAVPSHRVRVWAAGVVGMVRAAAEEWVATPADARLSREDLGRDLAVMLWDGAHVLFTTRPSPTATPLPSAGATPSPATRPPATRPPAKRLEEKVQ
jgi:AcrR family transcriptional regulator